MNEVRNMEVLVTKTGVRTAKDRISKLKLYAYSDINNTVSIFFFIYFLLKESFFVKEKEKNRIKINQDRETLIVKHFKWNVNTGKKSRSRYFAN